MCLFSNFAPNYKPSISSSHSGAFYARTTAGLAAVLSFLIPGLGQIYNGEIGKGIIIIIVQIINGFLATIIVGFITGAIV